MSKLPARKEEISLELQETIEKLESILTQIKTVPKKDRPSINLVKRLVETSEAFGTTVGITPPPLVKRLPLIFVSILALVLIGVGIYFYNLSTIKQEVAEITQEITQTTPQPIETILPPSIAKEEGITQLEKTTETLPQEGVTTETLPQLEVTTETLPQLEVTTETLPQEQIELTPEESFLVGIKQSISSYSNQLQENLINSVKVDFEKSSLAIKLDSAWYTLTETQQDKLVEDIWQRSQNLAFNKIELVDPQEKVLARSPVVGKRMIILRRVSL